MVVLILGLGYLRITLTIFDALYYLCPVQNQQKRSLFER
jgi:hypothetical protein